ncbi:MAG: hypothetical protein IKO15_01645, partial [Clostridiales bacterium]|nr:hypothetical protein [Clostridiales bacterium]
DVRNKINVRVGHYVGGERRLFNSDKLLSNIEIVFPSQGPNYNNRIKNKKVLVLIDSATTGSTLKSAIGSIRFYGGTCVGISAIFSVATQIDNIPIRSLFSTKNLPDYASYHPGECPLCSKNVPVDAICNGFGYSTVQ